MSLGAKLSLKIAGTAAVLGVAGWMLVKEFRGMLRHGRGQTMVWFYDESEKKLYSMPDTTIPPDVGIGGPRDDGDKAIVVTFGHQGQDRSKWRIAYLTKYAPELKKLLDESILARAAGQVFNGSVPPRQSNYFQSNTLVKREADTDWHAVNTPEGRAIVNEWRSWQGADGAAPIICSAE